MMTLTGSSEVVADIGCDHSLLAWGLSMLGQFDGVIGVDLSEQALQHVALALLEQQQPPSGTKLDFILRNGLEPPEALVDLICLAGMGVHTILNHGGLLPRAELRTFWSLFTGSVLIGLLGLIWEDPQLLIPLTITDGLVLLYLGVFSSSVTFLLTQRATAVLTPAAITSYSYLVPFVLMLLLFIDQPQRIGWHWFPSSLMVVITVSLLLKRDATNYPTDQHFKQ